MGRKKMVGEAKKEEIRLRLSKGAMERVHKVVGTLETNVAGWVRELVMREVAAFEARMSAEAKGKGGDS